MTTCTKCQGQGFLNLEQISDETIQKLEDSDCFLDATIKWLSENEGHDVQVCDCCGDGEDWYGTPGSHYNGEEREGVYDYNGGLCECH